MNNHILSQLVNEHEIEVFKTMRDDMATAGGILNPEQYLTFLQQIQIEQSLLRDAGFKRMNREHTVTSSTRIKGHVLQDGYKADKQTTNNELTNAELGFGKVELNAYKMKAKCHIFDDDKEDNIERESFEQTLLQMMAKQVGLDLEEVAVYGKKSYTATDQNKAFYGCIDGWLETAKDYQVKSKGAGGSDFDLENGVDAMFDAMRYKLPRPYMRNLSQLCFYVPFEVYEAYQNLIASRSTALGDANLIGAPELKYKNIPVKYAPVLDSADGRTVFGNVPSILTVPNYMWYGVYKDISVEPKRIVENEDTEYYFRIRCDAALEWSDAFITSVITPTEAAALPAQNKS